MTKTQPFHAGRLATRDRTRDSVRDPLGETRMIRTSAEGRAAHDRPAHPAREAHGYSAPGAFAAAFRPLGLTHVGPGSAPLRDSDESPASAIFGANLRPIRRSRPNSWIRPERVRATPFEQPTTQALADVTLRDPDWRIGDHRDLYALAAAALAFAVLAAAAALLAHG